MNDAADEGFQVEIRAVGRGTDGQPIYSNDRLFFQFMAFGGCSDLQPVVDACTGSDLDAALYRDVNDPLGFGLACVTRDPGEFVTRLHPFLRESGIADYEAKPGFTMLGYSYTIGYENDLAHVLVQRPYTRLINPDLPWVVFYPLRRNGAFSLLEGRAQRKILAEHGTIGQAFGAADLAHDIRLACFGLDADDNDFIIGLLGSELQPLSAVVQTMRKTQQTAKYIEKLGPFFVGRVAWQSAAREI